MKKIVLLFATLSMVMFGLTACGGEKNNGGSNANNQTDGANANRN